MCLVPDTRLRAVRRLNGYYPDQPRGQVTDVAIDDAEERADRFLICGDAVEIAHLSKSCRLDDLFLR